MAPHAQKPLGEILLEQGSITAPQLQSALKQQTKTQNLLGTILYSMGACNQLTLYTALARQKKVPYINLEKKPADTSLLKESLLNDYLRLHVFPWRIDTNGKVTVATSTLSPDVSTWCNNEYGADGYELVLSSQRDIERSIAKHFHAIFTDQSCNELWQKSPALSAKETLLRKHSIAVVLTGMAASALAYFFSLEAFLAVLILIDFFCLGTLAFKAILFSKGIKLYDEEAARPAEIFTLNIPDHQLPIYSTLYLCMMKPAACPHSCRIFGIWIIHRTSWI